MKGDQSEERNYVNWMRVVVSKDFQTIRWLMPEQRVAPDQVKDDQLREIALPITEAPDCSRAFLLN